MPTIQNVSLPDGRDVRIYRSPKRTVRGVFCSATTISRQLGNRLIGGKFLKKPPADPKELIKKLEA